MDDKITQLIAGIIYGLIPIIMYYFWKERPPKGINRIYGYRTSMSMKNEATWRVANNYATKFLVPIGVLTIILTIAFFFILDEFNLLVVIFFVVSSVSIIPFTEWHLRKHFDKDGNPKKSSAGDQEP
ncbi:MAG: SdpI family protein [Cyclobacteriaceae bacterium]